MRLQNQYYTYNKYVVAYKGQLNNIMCVPKIKKLVINVSNHNMLSNNKFINNIFEEVFLITGQKPSITKAKKSISDFKLKIGSNIGIRVTLRGIMMYEFIDRLINLALPRSRNFNGFYKKKFNDSGNYCFGIREQIIFHEIIYNKVDSIRGIGIVIVTNSSNNSIVKKLLELFNFPFVD